MSVHVNFIVICGEVKQKLINVTSTRGPLESDSEQSVTISVNNPNVELEYS